MIWGLIGGKSPPGIQAVVDTPKKPPTSLMAFTDSQAAIDGTLEAWLPRLIESNEILVAALERVRDLHSGGEPVDATEVRSEVETALERAASMQRGF
jgi:hypothetical protein